MLQSVLSKSPACKNVVHGSEPSVWPAASPDTMAWIVASSKLAVAASLNGAYKKDESIGRVTPACPLSAPGIPMNVVASPRDAEVPVQRSGIETEGKKLSAEGCCSFGTNSLDGSEEGSETPGGVVAGREDMPSWSRLPCVDTEGRELLSAMLDVEWPAFTLDPTSSDDALDGAGDTVAVRCGRTTNAPP